MQEVHYLALWIAGKEFLHSFFNIELAKKHQLRKFLDGGTKETTRTITFFSSAFTIKAIQKSETVYSQTKSFGGRGDPNPIRGFNPCDCKICLY